MFKDTKAFSSFSVDDVPRAKRFYTEILGLDASDEEDGLAIHLAGGGEVFVYPKGDAHAPASFTVLNFPVDDIEAAVDRLTAAGLEFEQYEDLGTDEKGIARTDDGPKIAWFKDPAGNVLSVVQ